MGTGGVHFLEVLPEGGQGALEKGSVPRGEPWGQVLFCLSHFDQALQPQGHTYNDTCPNGLDTPKLTVTGRWWSP